MEAKFQALLETHWPTLKKMELILNEPSQILKRKEQSGETTYVEIFTWKDKAAADEAHHIPEVQAIWEPMGKMIREVDGDLGWSFRHFERIAPNHK